MSQDDDSGKKRPNPWGTTSGNQNNKKGKDTPWGISSSRPHGSGNRGGSGGGPEDFGDILKDLRKVIADLLPGNMKESFVGFLILGVVLALWLASGFYIINPGEHGVIQRFGAWTRTQNTEGLGYHWPTPIEQVKKVNVNQQRGMTIGYTENQSSSSYMRNKSTSSIKRSVQNESLMLTADRNIVDLQMALQWDIKSAEQYLFEIADPDNTIKKVAESAIREVAGQTDMFPIITTGRAQIETKVKDIIQTNLDEYNSGVNIKQVLIQKAEVHPDVQQAFQDVQSSRQDAEDTENIARAHREKILPKARGQAIQLVQGAEAYKQSKIAQATGDAQRFHSIYEAYLGGKDVTKERIYIETMEDVLSNAEKIIIDKNSSTSGVVPYLPLDSLKGK
ncbi:MAG: FtsH protease activity modulator HflK [Alphaproteobacteria bacterium]|nr:FtsH protease activity modulator HflK [Alphaproteobacteria bacterium]